MYTFYITCYSSMHTCTTMCTCYIYILYMKLHTYVYLFDTHLSRPRPRNQHNQHRTEEKNCAHNASKASDACNADKCSANTTYSSRCCDFLAHNHPPLAVFTMTSCDASMEGTELELDRKSA